VRRARYESQDTTTTGGGEREGGADFLSAGKAKGKFLVVRLYPLIFRLGLAGESPSHQATTGSNGRLLARSLGASHAAARHWLRGVLRRRIRGWRAAGFVGEPGDVQHPSVTHRDHGAFCVRSHAGAPS